MHWYFPYTLLLYETSYGIMSRAKQWYLLLGHETYEKILIFSVLPNIILFPIQYKPNISYLKLFQQTLMCMANLVFIPCKVNTIWRSRPYSNNTLQGRGCITETCFGYWPLNIERLPLIRPVWWSSFGSQNQLVHVAYMDIIIAYWP